MKDLAWQYLGEDRSEDCQTLEKVSGPVLRSLQGKEILPLYREIELPLTRVLAAMELTGVKADVKNLELLSGEMARKIKTLESLAKEQAGEERCV